MWKRRYRRLLRKESQDGGFMDRGGRTPDIAALAYTIILIAAIIWIVFWR